MRLWRHSLRFRTILLTLGLTALAVITACVWMALAIQNDLFTSRRDQVLADAQQATAAAQRTLDAAAQGDSVQVQNVMNLVRGTLGQQSSSDVNAAFRIGPVSQSAPQDFASDLRIEGIITEGLRASVRSNPDRQVWQSVALPADDGGTVPGILVGQQLTVSGVGPYELYLGYDLANAPQTLGFVQGTLWIVGIALVLIISGIAWFVLRSVTTPIGEAADTSAKLASGDLGVRLAVRGEDELATLGRSFNAMADSIESQIKELADLSLVQQRFVSDVSHELRTPLTTIRLAADMINDQRDEFDPATARAAELLNAQVQRFETLLTDLLEISRYDAGSVQLELEPTSLAHLAEDVIASMQQLADQHGTDVRLVRSGRVLAGRDGPAPRPPGRAQPAGQRDRARRRAPDRGDGRQPPAGGRDRRARLRPGHEARGRRARVRPILAGRPLAHPHHRRHRPRAVDRARRRPAPRRRAGGLVGTRSRHQLRAHAPARQRSAHGSVADPHRSR